MPIQARSTAAIVARFGSLEFFEEETLAPGASVIRPSMPGAEVITFVREGEMSFDDGVGHRGSLIAGDFRRLTIGTSSHLVEGNASRTEKAHVFHLWLHPAQDEPEPAVEQRRFSVADRRGAPCLVAAPDARGGALRVRQDAHVYSAVLHRGQHVVHPLGPERAVWVHVVEGNVTLGGLALLTGDGAGVRHQRAASITSLASSELLLIDVAAASARVIDSSHEEQRPRRYRYG